MKNVWMPLILCVIANAQMINVYAQVDKFEWEGSQFYYYNEDGERSQEGYDAWYNGDNDHFMRSYIVMKDGKYAFMLKDGEIYSEWYDDVDRYRGGVAHVSKDGRHALIDLEGENVGGWQDWITYYPADSNLITVMKGDQFAYINMEGDMVTEWYTGLQGFSKGVCVVRTCCEEYLIDRSGEVIAGPYEDISTVYHKNFTGYPVVTEDGKKYGYINRKGEAITEMEYDKAEVMRNDSAYVEKEGKYAYINPQGQVIGQWKDLGKQIQAYAEIKGALTYAPDPGTLRYNALNFGAKGDGKSDNTQALQQAIDRCTQTGGTVYLPAGTYLTGTLFLKDNVELHLQRGAILRGSPDRTKYPALESTLGSITGKKFLFLVYAWEAKNIAITGPGTIDGNGHHDWWREVQNRREPFRPMTLGLFYSENVKLMDYTIKNAVCWTQHIAACKNVRIEGLRVYSHDNHNTDGIDIEDCENVTMSDCIIDSHDDGICLKSEGNGMCENITISNCVVSSHCNPIKFGTRSAGGFRNITIENCVIKPSDDQHEGHGISGGLAGIALECVDGGILENININNISVEGVLTPIFIRLANRSGDRGTLRNVNISNVTGSYVGRIACSITGIPGSIVENVQLSNIRITAEGGGTLEDVNRLIPEVEKSYPETTKFGKSLPAYGFYIRHAKNIRFSNVIFDYDQDDQRPAMVFDDVKTFSVDGLTAEGPNSGQPVVWIKASADGIFSGLQLTRQAASYLKVEGSRNIQLLDSDLGKVTRDVVFE